ncbi:MAG TPA: hypothetical protein PLM93_00550 [Sulfuricurvum sp.]|nr:MAG: hypothetical protein B7Y30_04340 [Campylobacterales bacterium 16-40-21]HQS65660.1 hypothetical protein [Sulfuricurvum sp.]HQT36166.1 hypothetical protein [Sulfuricurvum sp.]
MQVQTNSSSPSFNPYEIQSDPIQEQLRGDFITVAPQLTPSEKRLYNSLMYTQDYQGAKDIIALGFIRTTALEKTDTPQRLLDIKA